jgi:ABC-type multidrug transport system permease subunit
MAWELRSGTTTGKQQMPGFERRSLVGIHLYVAFHAVCGVAFHDNNGADRQTGALSCLLPAWLGVGMVVLLGSAARQPGVGMVFGRGTEWK